MRPTFSCWGAATVSEKNRFRGKNRIRQRYVSWLDKITSSRAKVQDNTENAMTAYRDRRAIHQQKLQKLAEPDWRRSRKRGAWNRQGSQTRHDGSFACSWGPLHLGMQGNLTMPRGSQFKPNQTKPNQLGTTIYEQYQVKWTGYDDSSWVDESNLNYPGLLRTFYEQRGSCYAELVARGRSLQRSAQQADIRHRHGLCSSQSCRCLVEHGKRWRESQVPTGTELLESV